MEKINREELMKMANLTEEDLRSVSGGERDQKCVDNCNSARLAMADLCYYQKHTPEEIQKCVEKASDWFHNECLPTCKI